MTTSGVATQSRHLIEGLLETQKYDIVQLGAAIRHGSYETQEISDSFKIIPCNGFGNKSFLFIDTFNTFFNSFTKSISR